MFRLFQKAEEERGYMMQIVVENGARKLKDTGTTGLLYFLGRLSFNTLTLIELYYFSPFMTEGAKFPAAIVATIMSVTTTVDFIFSFFIGVIIEKLKLPWGRLRSWFLVAPVVVTICLILMFSKVSNDNYTLCGIIIFIGFFVSHMAWSCAESCLNALPMLLTEDGAQRTQLSIWNGRGAMANTIVFGIIAPPLLVFFQNISGSSVLRYTYTAVFFSLIYWIGMWMLFVVTKKFAPYDKPASSVKKEATLIPALKSAFTNGSLLSTMFCTMMVYLYMITQSSGTFYLFTYTFGGGAIMAYMGITITSFSVVKLAGSFLFNLLLKFFNGNKKSFFLTGWFGVAIINLFLYIAKLPPWPTIVLTAVANFCNAIILGLIFALYMDCAVYSELKAGKDIKNFIMTLIIIPTKLGILLRGYVVSAVLVGIAYSTDAVDKSAYPDAFRGMYMLTAAICAFAAALVFLFGYRLNEGKVADMQKEITARKEATA
jgi:Na+/melibiose symporter-like transporter